MKPGFLAPAGTLDKKPPHGQPCNRCGLCCVATVCPLGQVVFGRALGPCPALSYEPDGKSVCGLVATPQRFGLMTVLRHGAKAAADAASYLIGSGTGCDARFNGEPPDVGFYEKLIAWDRANKGAIRAAKRIWGIR